MLLFYTVSIEHRLVTDTDGHRDTDTGPWLVPGIVRKVRDGGDNPLLSLSLICPPFPVLPYLEVDAHGQVPVLSA